MPDRYWIGSGDYSPAECRFGRPAKQSVAAEISSAMTENETIPRREVR
jgi:hypothetical protein